MYEVPSHVVKLVIRLFVYVSHFSQAHKSVKETLSMGSVKKNKNWRLHSFGRPAPDAKDSTWGQKGILVIAMTKKI